MKTLNGIEITHEHSFNLLEGIKDSFHDGDEILSLIDYCEELLADERLDVYPDIEMNGNNIVTFNYENYSDDLICNHLLIKVNTYGVCYTDKVLSYYYIKDDDIFCKEKVSWNVVLEVIKRWHKE